VTVSFSQQHDPHDYSDNFACCSERVLALRNHEAPEGPDLGPKDAKNLDSYIGNASLNAHNRGPTTRVQIRRHYSPGKRHWPVNVLSQEAAYTDQMVSRSTDN
jgi:hypothetical protein